MDISILSGPKPCVFECMHEIMLHVYALHKERNDLNPPNDITDKIDRVYEYLKGNG